MEPAVQLWPYNGVPWSDHHGTWCQDQRMNHAYRNRTRIRGSIDGHPSPRRRSLQYFLIQSNFQSMVTGLHWYDHNCRSTNPVWTTFNDLRHRLLIDLVPLLTRNWFKTSINLFLCDQKIESKSSTESFHSWAVWSSFTINSWAWNAFADCWIEQSMTTINGTNIVSMMAWPRNEVSMSSDQSGGPS